MCIRSAPSRIRKIKDFQGSLFFFISLCLPLPMLSCPASVSLSPLYNCSENLQTLAWWQIGHMLTSIKSMKTVEGPSLGV